MSDGRLRRSRACLAAIAAAVALVVADIALLAAGMAGVVVGIGTVARLPDRFLPMAEAEEVDIPVGRIDWAERVVVDRVGRVAAGLAGYYALRRRYPSLVNQPGWVV